MADRTAPFDELTPAARERFGELLGKQLWVTAGGIAALIVAPGIVGSAKVAVSVQVAGAVVAFSLAAAGSLIHYFLIERRTDALEELARNG
ncbi:MAG: hypothetical protein ACOY4K_07715 [Pseudomonadota bacterium]